MASVIPRAIADVELQLASAISVGSTSFTLNSANDDDGNALPAGIYCFTIDSGTSNKEYLLGQLNGTAVTSVQNVSRQGVESSGADRAHRIGAPCIVTNFATLQRVADILRGDLSLDGSNPIIYDAEPTLADRKEVATVGYVLDTVVGGTVVFDQQVITGNGGEAIVAGNLVYFKTSDQEWYKTDADTAATVEGVQLGIALGTGSDGVSISGGIQIAGTWTTTGLTAGALYYASNTAGAISSSAGTTSRIVGIALSTTKLLIIPRNPQDIKDSQKDALVGAGATPSSSNKFLTVGDVDDNTLLPPPQVVTFTASGTWTKDAGLKYVIVEVVGGGGGGGGDTVDVAAGGGGGGYSKKLIAAASLGATETVTVGAGGVGTYNAETAGGTTSFGSHLSATGGQPGGTDRPDEPGSGGSGSNGDLNIDGMAGSVADTTLGSSGMGGNSFYGVGGASKSNSGAGNPGLGYGGGGSGADSGGPDTNGGAGTAGIVIVTEYYS